VLQNKLCNGKLSGKQPVKKVLQASSKKASKRGDGGVNNTGAVKAREVKKRSENANYPITRNFSH
jgi:hypothetical protein